MCASGGRSVLPWKALPALQTILSLPDLRTMSANVERLLKLYFIFFKF